MTDHFGHITLFYGLQLVDQYTRGDGDIEKATEAFRVLRRHQGMTLFQIVAAYWSYQSIRLTRPLLPR